MRRGFPAWAVTGLLVLGFAGALEALTRGKVLSAAVVVPPTQMIAELVALFRGDLLEHIVRSMSELVVAAAIAFMLGSMLGLLFWLLPRLGQVLEPYIIAMYAVPLVLFYPFMLVVVGLGPASVIIIAAAMGTVPVTLNVWIGLRELKDIYLQVARSVNASPWQLGWKVILPAAAPMVFAGFKLGFIYSFIGTIASEFITATAGLGFLIARDYNYFNTGAMYAEILLVIVIAWILNTLLIKLEQRIANR